jgi:endonuclease/exonuclease/phosphatase family metal-dependent hydrolase
VAKPLRLLILTVLVLVGWYAYNHYELRGLRMLKLVPRGASASGADQRPEARAKESIRIATFNMQAFGPAKAERTDTLELVARMIRRFDVIALQEIRSERPDVVQQLLARVNATGGHYGLIAGPRVGRTEPKEQFVFLFDQTTVEADHSAAYTVEDPDDLLHHPPFVGCFRARGAPPEQAFTFTLVNLHLHPDTVAEEVQVLDNVFFAVRDDGRGEDDVILLGDFRLDDRSLHDLGRVSGMLAAISGRPTNTRQTEQLDNLVFQLPATAEYRSQSGIFDFMREFNLTTDQALQVSDHLPVWAEFSVVEGGAQPAVANTPSSSQVW